MKGIIAIILLITILFLTKGLMKLPAAQVVVEHLQEHQKTGSAFSLFHFLFMHYVSDDLNNADNFTDTKLPFKVPYIFISNNPIDSITMQSAYWAFQNEVILKNKYSIYRKSLLFKNINAGVWHPPQIA